MSEDPKRALMQDLPISIDYYLEKKLKPVIKRLFGMVFTDKQMSYIFSPPNKIKKKSITKKKGTIGFFFGLKKKCISCNRGIKEGNICNKCKSKKKSIYDKIIGEKEILQEKVEKARQKCKDCQGEGFIKLVCTNDDCEWFYKGIQYERELKKKEDVIKQFDW